VIVLTIDSLEMFSSENGQPSALSLTTKFSMMDSFLCVWMRVWVRI